MVRATQKVAHMAGVLITVIIEAINLYADASACVREP